MHSSLFWLAASFIRNYATILIFFFLFFRIYSRLWRSLLKGDGSTAVPGNTDNVSAQAGYDHEEISPTVREIINILSALWIIMQLLPCHCLMSSQSRVLHHGTMGFSEPSLARPDLLCCSSAQRHRDLRASRASCWDSSSWAEAVSVFGCCLPH